MNLNIVYSSDNNYAQHVGVSLISLFENNKQFNKINVYIIENKINILNKKNLIYICNKYNRSIEFIKFSEFSNKLNLNIGNSISISSYARLFLSSVIDTSIEKILYLDSDSIINDSLAGLWNLDINDYYVAGVCDTVSDDTKLRINLDIDTPYINAGMLLINLKKWREEEIEKKFLEFIALNKGQVFHHDQGTINGVLNQKFLLLHPKYNSMATFFTMTRKEIMKYYGLKNYYNSKELDEAVNNPVFIHFTPAFVNRPWIKGCKHPLSYLYHKYLKMTPWKDIGLNKDNRSKGEKIVAFIFNNLPFKIANSLTNLIFK